MINICFFSVIWHLCTRKLEIISENNVLSLFFFKDKCSQSTGHCKLLLPWYIYIYIYAGQSCSVLGERNNLFVIHCSSV